MTGLETILDTNKCMYVWAQFSTLYPQEYLAIMDKLMILFFFDFNFDWMQ